MTNPDLVESTRKMVEWAATLDDPAGMIDIDVALALTLVATIAGDGDDRSVTDQRALGTLSNTLMKVLDTIAARGVALEEAGYVKKPRRVA